MHHESIRWLVIAYFIDLVNQGSLMLVNKEIELILLMEEL